MRIKPVFALLLFISLLFLAACGRDKETPTPAPAEPTATPAPANTEAPTNTPAPADTPTTAPAATPDAADPKAAIEALLAASLQLSVTTPVTMGIEGVHAFALQTSGGQPLWLAHTVGLRNFDPLQDHVMAIYRPDSAGWAEVARQVMAAGDDADHPKASPDYLGEGTVTQEQVAPEGIWIQVQGGVGAHGGVYGLYSFDGAAFKEEATGFSASPGASRLQDLNGDGVQEVLLDATDSYVFCYACGVRLVDYTILRWDGSQMLPVPLEPLPDAAPAEAKAYNDNLLKLANGGLWKDALALVEQPPATGADDATLVWNMAHVRLIAESRRDEIFPEAPFPLLSNVFYGDYAAAVEILRDAGADAVFIQESPVITGAAVGNESAIADYIASSVNPALEAQPDLAAAYFIRGWGNYLRAFDEAAAVEDVKKAAELAPKDEFYRKSVEFLTE